MESEGSVQCSQENLSQIDDIPNEKRQKMVYQKQQFMAITASIIITIITTIITQTFA